MPGRSGIEMDNPGVEEIAETLGVNSRQLSQTVYSVALVIGLLLLRWALKRWARGQLSDADDDAQYRANKTINYVITILMLVGLLFIWLDSFGSLTTYLGLVSAGIAIALSDLLKNMAGWAFILSRHPLRVGDRIEVRGMQGDVIDIRLFRFTVMEVGNWVDADQSTGRLIHIPNGIVFTDSVANYTEGFTHIWDEIPVTVTFESDWELAENLIRAAIADHVPDAEAAAGNRIRATAREYQIRIGRLTPTVYLDVQDIGVRLTARYLVEARQRRTIQQEVWKGILRLFEAEPSVHFAYPTVRTYFEGPISVSGPPFE